MAQILNKSNIQTEIKEYEGLAIVDFIAKWCGPCKMMNPIIESLAAEYNGSVRFYKINVDEEPELAAGLGASSIPMFVFVAPDAQPYAMRGAMSKESMKRLIKRHLLDKVKK